MSKNIINVGIQQNTVKYTIGKHSYGIISIEGDHLLDNIIVGNFCSIGTSVEVMVIGWGHNTDWVTTYPFESFSSKWSNAKKIIPYIRSPRNITIGNDVWIGKGVVIMSGVKIGDGACIGTNTVVSKDVPPYTIAVGAPMKFVRQRFSDTDVKFLLDIKWWDWEDTKINEYVDLISSSNITELRRKYGS